MSSHANCTHEKTKAARAACRAGKEPRGDMPQATPATDRLREKAASASEKLSQPKAEGATSTTPAQAVSGFCANGTHDRCPGGGKQWHCSCDCHSA